MMQPMKSVANVNRGIKLAQFFISPTELQILIREIDSLPIFIALKDRAEKPFKAKEDSTVN